MAIETVITTPGDITIVQISEATPILPQLNPNRPDFEALVSALQTNLQVSNAWNLLETSGTGQTIVRWLAAIGTFAVNSIERELQETYLDTARRSSSIVRACNHLGVPIDRYSQGTIGVTLTRQIGTVPITWPAFTTWQIGSFLFYNRTAIVIPINVLQYNVILHSGTLVTQTISSDGSPYQRYVFGPPDFSTSRSDLTAVVSDSQDIWTSTTNGLWRKGPTSKVFEDRTRPDGTVEIRFGNGQYGSIPTNGSKITFTYVQVNLMRDFLPQNGDIVLVNDPTNLAKDLTPLLPGDSSLKITSTANGTFTPASAQKTGTFYKTLGASLGASKSVAVRRQDHRALAVTYPGVIDATWLGQAEINPSDIRWMCVVGFCLLTKTPWTSTAYRVFNNWFVSTIGMSNIVLYDFPAVPIVFDIQISVIIVASSDAATVVSSIKDWLTNFFTPRLGLLGMELTTSDIVEGIINGVNKIPDNPIVKLSLFSIINDTILTKTQYPVLGKVDITTKYQILNDLSLIRTIDA